MARKTRTRTMLFAAALASGLAGASVARAADQGQDGNDAWRGGHPEWRPGVDTAIANQAPSYAPPNSYSSQRFDGWPYGYQYGYPPGYGYGSTKYGYQY